MSQDSGNDAPRERAAQLGRGAVAAASGRIEAAVAAALRDARNDPKIAAEAFLARLRTDSALAESLFVSFSGSVMASVKQDFRRRK